jgi:hypothetical protein
MVIQELGAEKGRLFLVLKCGLDEVVDDGTGGVINGFEMKNQIQVSVPWIC